MGDLGLLDGTALQRLHLEVPVDRLDATVEEHHMHPGIGGLIDPEHLLLFPDGKEREFEL